jgi:integrase/recombinase XerD
MPREYLEQSDVGKLEEAATNLRNCLLIRLLSHLGCRITEALSIKVEDIDFSSSTVRILHLKTRLELSCPKCGSRVAAAHTFCPKCGEKVLEAVTRELEHRRQRVIPVDSRTLAMISEYINSNRPVIRAGNQVLFGINQHRGWQIVKRCAEKANLTNLINPETGKIRGISPHRLRDAFAVHAMKVDDSGDGMRLLQEHLGHASFNTTAKYRKIASEEHKSWFEKLWQQKN